MQTYIECIPCFFRQAIEAAHIANVDIALQKKIIDAFSLKLKNFSLDLCPPAVGKEIYRIVKKITKNPDPYINLKRKSNQAALKVYPEIKKVIAKTADPLLKAVEAAIAGNILDYGIANKINLNNELRKIINCEHSQIKHQKKKFFAYTKFKKNIDKSNTLLYIGDNAGEIVFDRILIEEIIKIDPKKKIYFAVKKHPIINDALIGDAYSCKLHNVAKVITSGIDIPGTILSCCSKSFINIFEKADMVISKGQGNFEALSNEKVDKKIFFLFMAKCPVVAKHLGCLVNTIILAQHNFKP